MRALTVRLNMSNWIDSGLLMIIFYFICRAAHIAKSEDCRGETLFVDLRREYHCSAYNALCAVIACTQTEQKFYSGFLFTENKIKVPLNPEINYHINDCIIW